MCECVYWTRLTCHGRTGPDGRLVNSAVPVGLAALKLLEVSNRACQRLPRTAPSQLACWRQAFSDALRGSLDDQVFTLALKFSEDSRECLCSSLVPACEAPGRCCSTLCCVQWPQIGRLEASSLCFQRLPIGVHGHSHLFSHVTGTPVGSEPPHWHLRVLSE